MRCSIGSLLARSSRNRLVSPGEHALVASHAWLLSLGHYLHFDIFGIPDQDYNCGDLSFYVVIKYISNGNSILNNS